MDATCAVAPATTSLPDDHSGLAIPLKTETTAATSLARVRSCGALIQEIYRSHQNDSMTLSGDKEGSEEAIEQEHDLDASPDVVPVDREDEELEEEAEAEEEDRESDDIEEREDDLAGK